VDFSTVLIKEKRARIILSVDGEKTLSVFVSGYSRKRHGKKAVG